LALRFLRDPLLDKALGILISKLGLSYIKTDRIYIAWSRGSKTTALARIWGLPSPFVKLGICEPAYVIELISEKFPKLSCDEIVETLIHELLHIPRTFSGGLRAHGEWSKKRNIKKIVKEKLRKEDVETLCHLVKLSLKRISNG
jgi:predicted metallopeptidase